MRKLLFAVVLLFHIVSVYGFGGEVLSFKMKDSVIYPGTERTIKVYVPEQYTGDSPACLLVRMDYWWNGMFDAVEELIDEGVMPVTVIILIEPGKIYNPDGSVIRYNRSNEFDRTDGRFAQFLQTEVIPEACKLITSDGRRVTVSDSARDRAISGDSSGGIAAFCAAWNKPDLFSRVYSCVGTFVPMRGGDQLPGLVRKMEPRPIRIFLQDNDKDSWNLLFGSWYEENLRLAGALEFAGYDIRHQWDEGGHSGANGIKIYKEVLRYLWEGWPGAVTAGVSANKTLQNILGTDSDWQEEISLPNARAEGGATIGAKCAVYPGGTQISTLQEGSNWVLNALLSPEGSKIDEQEYYCLHSQAYQILYDKAGYLYAATPLGIQICDHNGRVRAILLPPSGQEVTGIALVGNRLFAQTPDGRIYSRLILREGFSNPFSTPVPPREDQG